jgi:hypothetical protein
MKQKGNKSGKSVKVTATSTETVIEKLEEGMPGRPIDLNSKRQQELLQREIKKQLGKLHKGRPIDPNSPRQLREKEKAEKRAAGLLKPGRPAYTEAEREEAEKIKEQKENERLALAAEQAKKLIEENKVHIEEGKVVFDEPLFDEA